jgi:hypothetical protein
MCQLTVSYLAEIDANGSPYTEMTSASAEVHIRCHQDRLAASVSLPLQSGARKSLWFSSTTRFEIATAVYNRFAFGCRV